MSLRPPVLLLGRRGLRGETAIEDQYAGETYFLHQLRGHRWRTRNPEEALLFVVPLYANAAFQPSMKGLSCNGTHYMELFDRTARAVAASPQYARHRGADHLLVSNSWRIALRAPKQVPWAPSQRSTDSFRHIFRNAIVGHMETRHAKDAGFWRCSVVSPYVANFDERAAPHLRPPRERELSYYFQGGANNRGSFGYALRQAALAQLETLDGAAISAFSLPGKPAPCSDALRSNCKSARSAAAFRSRIASAKFNLLLRGDSPTSRRLYDGVASGAVPVLVSDLIWALGLPFQCLVPWRDLAVTVAEAAFVSEAGANGTLSNLSQLEPAILERMQRLSNAHRRDLIWNLEGSRVAENVLITATHRCLPSRVAQVAAAASATAAATLEHLGKM